MRLPVDFFARDALQVAPDLIGRWLVRDDVVLRITEVEAYCWPDDTASHGRAGRTARTAPMFGPPGRAYVYLCYGIHQMLNLVSNAEGEAAAVLIRAAEPVGGLEVVRQRRGGKAGPDLLVGPGRLAAALAMDGSFNHHAVYEAGGLEVHEGTPAERLAVGKRIGVDYARPEHRDAPWRFADADSVWVSRRRELRPAVRSGEEVQWPVSTSR